MGRGIVLLFHDRGTRRGWVVSSTPRSHFTPGKDPVPILQEASGPQGRSWRAEILVPTGIRSRTVQPVVSRYTDWPTRSTLKMYIYWNNETTSGVCPPAVRRHMTGCLQCKKQSRFYVHTSLSSILKTNGSLNLVNKRKSFNPIDKQNNHTCPARRQLLQLYIPASALGE